MMTIPGQIDAIVAEQPTGTAQHIEYADTNDDTFHVAVRHQQETDTEQQSYVGPWPLRHRRNSSWTVLSGKSDATRRSFSNLPVNSAAVNNGASPFIADLPLDNPFSDQFHSEASSSTMIAGSVDVPDSQQQRRKSELTRIMEQVDQKTEAIQRTVNREASSSRNEGKGENQEFKRSGEEHLADDSTGAQRRERSTAAQTLQVPPQQQRPRDIEREVAATMLTQLETEDCQTCQEEASVALAGKCMLGLTASILVASLYAIYYCFSEEFGQATTIIKEKQRTLLFLSLLAIPVTAALSMALLAWLGLNSYGPIKRRLNGGAEYFKLWLCFTFLALCSYFLIAAVSYKYAK
ncbi:hypothetical protein AYL99_11220 [Fonsecaea erecta]|uniref:Transmembrane protein n=1 Tax=Fonsecaea erecta TaxID=1367422 RepID=A0A178Z4X4_9EURO|nr:hypothetical protein AYL99_11220 [Fonsecaea erecta]OAP54772.1 hypothetical protein AYL99_11220 [Fonsecaea erecta]